MAAPTVARSRRMVVAMRAETTYGVDVLGGTYVAADIIPAFNVQPAINIEENENLSLAGDMGRVPSVAGLETGAVAFSMFWRGKGSAYAAGNRPEFDLPNRGCGLSSTVDATLNFEKVTYIPVVPASHESMTIYVVQENGRTLKLAGCFGTVDLAMRAGGMIEARYAFQGLIAGVSDVTYVEGSIGGTPAYPTFKSALFQIDTTNYAPRIANVGVGLGNMVQRLVAINAAGGCAGYYISDRRPVLTIDPEMDTIANYDWFTKWKTAVLADCTFQAGATQYARVKFSFDKVQNIGQQHSVREGITTLPTTLLATLTAGLDDLSIVAD